MRVCIHRGSRQIGGSCVEVEAEGRRLILDLGLPLDAEANDARYLPPVRGLTGGDPGLLGILISHPHLDHFGLLAHVPRDIPVGLGPAARRILAAAAPFLPQGCPEPVSGWNYESGQLFEVGPFRVTPFLVDHSANDAYSLMIEAGGRRLFYSGDFRAHGRKSALFQKLVKAPPPGIDALLIEGSSLSRLGDDERFPTEQDLEAAFVEVFHPTRGLALVHTSAQNIDRIVTIFRACVQTGRTLVIDLYAAAILEATGNDRLPQSWWDNVALYIPEAQRRLIKKNSWFDMLKRHSTNRLFMERLQQNLDRFTLLFRPQHMTDLEKSGCLDGARFIYSQWEGYWEQGAYAKVRDALERHGIEKLHIHTSGHASPADLKTLVTALAPRRVIPIHSFRPDRYSELFENVEIHGDGEWWEV